MKTKTLAPWNVKPGMLVAVPQFEHDFALRGYQFAPVVSVHKFRSAFTGCAVWRIDFPRDTWPTAHILVHAKWRSLLLERVLIRVD